MPVSIEALGIHLANVRGVGTGDSEKISLGLRKVIARIALQRSQFGGLGFRLEYEVIIGE